MIPDDKLTAGGVIVLDGETAIETARRSRSPGSLASSPASVPRPSYLSMPPMA